MIRDISSRFIEAKNKYAAIGVDTDLAIEKLREIPVSLHCWQGDDVTGFDQKGPLTGGIQATGNYPGKARNYVELMEDMEKAIRLMPGKKKLNIHASYAIFENGEFADRDKIAPKHFVKWVDFAKKHNMGIDFNPTFFSHSKIKNGLTLTSPDEDTRKFWIEHGKACIRIYEYFAKETGVPCVMNIWIGDGFKDIPADRLGPRMRYKNSIEQILSEPYDAKLVKPCVESKVFGVGVEAYTAGSAEFALTFAATHEGCLPLMDNGHYHPTEVVSDKIPALLGFFPEIKKRRKAIKENIDMLDSIVAEGAISNINLRLLVQEIQILDVGDGEIAVVIVINGPFNEYGEVFAENGDVKLAHNGDYKPIAV